MLNSLANVTIILRCIISHEAPYTGGFGAELSAAIQVSWNSSSFKFKILLSQGFLLGGTVRYLITV